MMRLNRCRGFEATLNKPFARGASLPGVACGVANPRDSAGYRCGSPLQGAGPPESGLLRAVQGYAGTPGAAALSLASHPYAGRATSPGPIQRRLNGLVSMAAAAVMLCACASTSVSIEPETGLSPCEPSSPAVVVWTTRWRADQKDVAEREVAAEAGLRDFFSTPECFSNSEVRRVEALPVAAPHSISPVEAERAIGIEVQELGPVVRLLSSAALIEGGTEVLLRVRAYAPAPGATTEFAVQWRHGGPGVVKGVGSLRQDMQAALRAGLLRQRR